MWDEIAPSARVLVIDDEPANVLLLTHILRRNGLTCITSTSDPREALELFAAVSPDLILLDLHMPYLDGHAILERLHLLVPADDYLPVLVLTADITPGAKRRALASGAKDFVTKPFDLTEVGLRIRNLLETRYLHQQVRRQNELLEERVRLRTHELEATQFELLERLALAAEFRDDATGRHTQRVGIMAAALAAGLGLPEREIELIRRAAPLHDLGKIGIPDHILLKPGRLSAAEFEVMKTHTTIGARILAGRSFPLLQLAEEIALTHHERWDGRSYPRGLFGEQIPVAGRIVAVADVFDALIHDRPYKPALSIERALQELLRGAGTHFDPTLVDLFQRALPIMLAAGEPQRPAPEPGAIGASRSSTPAPPSQ